MISDTITIEITQSSDIVLIFMALKQLERRSGYHFTSLELALSELLENILQHAYHADRSTPIDIKVTFTLKPCQLHISLQEFGEPFDFTPYLSEAIDQSSDHSKGFYLIYDLVDTFYFTNLGKQGKQFTLISTFSNCQRSETALPKTKPSLLTLDNLSIRAFKDGDETAISQLIYKNYDYTYYKALFYQPLLIKQSNNNKRAFSFIAEIDKEIIGHFSLVPRPYTNSAEVAVAVVHPLYKGYGIMNKMFMRLIQSAKKMQFRSLFGEAIMLHPYSQKANLNKGMHESAIVLGLVPGDIEIEHQLKIGQRSGVLVGYRIFKQEHFNINLPTRYKEQIEKCYDQFTLDLQHTPTTEIKHDIQTYIDEELNLGTIQVDADLDNEQLTTVIEMMMLEQNAMLYVDINLHRISEIDALVAHLNHHGFFYSGVLFDFYHDEDYLRSQKITSKEIDIDHLVTYSQFSRTLLDFIRKDKAIIAFNS